MAGRSKVCMEHEARIAALEEGIRWIKWLLGVLIVLNVSIGIPIWGNHIGWW